MNMENTYEKLQRLMNSYVPEFAYKKDGSDPGSVLSNLCGGMLDECAKRYDRVIPKHRIQYLNMFDSLLKEPVSASKGYVQFHPVAGYEGMVPVPAKTRVMATGVGEEELIFETEHDMTVSDTVPEWIAVTERSTDRVVVSPYGEEKASFYGFDIRGENVSEHRLYLGFDELFSHLNGLDLYVFVEAFTETEQQALLEALCSTTVKWAILDPEKGELVFSAVEIQDGAIHLQMEDYAPKKVKLGQKESYYLTLFCKDELPNLYIRSISVGFHREQIIPGEIFVNGISETGGGVYPFGKPLGLYNEFAFDEKETLGRKGATIQMKFQLSYRNHEEELEIPELDVEYKAIMKKPKKAASMRSAEVMADYVLWEYLSNTGWKNLFKEEHINAMFNGSTQGPVTLEFICPEDMAEYGAGDGMGRIRARLIRAENIYQVPAVYKCPFLTGLNLSYSYMENRQTAQHALLKNNFEEKDVTESLSKGGNVSPFYQTEHEYRTMYLGFSQSMAGTPFSLFFDIENYNDRPVNFQVEYLSDRGFTAVKTVDYTDGFTGSGNMLMMIPKDAAKRTLYGYEGYFLRFINYNKENPEYALPLIKGIYPNMARVVNVNTVTEEFYLQDMDNAVDIQLNQQNLLKLSVWVLEKEGENENWVLWRRAEKAYEGGRTYTVDMAEGLLHFRKHAFAEYELLPDGPHIRVEHSNYTGSCANVPKGAIQVLGTAVRYISSVNNPFPTYGGYDGYTEKNSMSLVSGMLRTRNRAVTNRDFFDIISQTAYGIRKVKCLSHVDMLGNPSRDNVTIAVLIEEYEKGAHVFSEIKKAIRDRLMQDSALLAMGRELTLVQPYFVKLNVRVWLEKENMEQAYDLQQKATDMIQKFIDPLEGGVSGNGWEIGELPRTSQIIACLRNGIAGCNISKIVMTALVDGKEVQVTDMFYEQMSNPFIMAVNGEHIVYIEVSAC
ncbi:MAG: hypothetical protein J6A94_00265 [Lachnospiraceae bacterium]|nr:hypothetical protein [Lachnospiraceae bacterium]